MSTGWGIAAGPEAGLPPFHNQLLGALADGAADPMAAASVPR